MVSPGSLSIHPGSLDASFLALLTPASSNNNFHSNSYFFPVFKTVTHTWTSTFPSVRWMEWLDHRSAGLSRLQFLVTLQPATASLPSSPSACLEIIKSGRLELSFNQISSNTEVSGCQLLTSPLGAQDHNTERRWRPQQLQGEFESSATNR